MAPFIETMPVYRIKAGDSVMWSLRFLAVFSVKATQLLDKYTVRPSDDTLASIAASLRTGRFVDSGRKCPPVHQPMSVAKMLLWLLVPLLVLLVLIPVGVAYLEYRQCCFSTMGSVSDYIRERAYRLNGPILVAAPLAALVLASEFVPGLWALWSDAKARRDRRDL